VQFLQLQKLSVLILTLDQVEVTLVHTSGRALPTHQIRSKSDKTFCGWMYVWTDTPEFQCIRSLLNDDLQNWGNLVEAVEARIHIGWNKFRQLVPLITNRDKSSIRRGRLYSSCVLSSMLHGSETWPVRKENEVALQWTEMRMVRWMCNVKVKDRVSSKVLRERLGINDILECGPIVS